MNRIAFIGFNNMGGPMAGNLVKAGHEMVGLGLSQTALLAARERGVVRTKSVTAAARARAVATILPSWALLLSVWQELGRVIASGALVVDCSTIDVETPRPAQVTRPNHLTLDAPVSDGTDEAEAGTLSFMSADTLDALKPLNTYHHPGRAALRSAAQRARDRQQTCATKCGQEFR